MYCMYGMIRKSQGLKLATPKRCSHGGTNTKDTEDAFNADKQPESHLHARPSRCTHLCKSSNRNHRRSDNQADTSLTGKHETRTSINKLNRSVCAQTMCQVQGKGKTEVKRTFYTNIYMTSLRLLRQLTLR